MSSERELEALEKGEPALQPSRPRSHRRGQEQQLHQRRVRGRPRQDRDRRPRRSTSRSTRTGKAPLWSLRLQGLRELRNCGPSCVTSRKSTGNALKRRTDPRTLVLHQSIGSSLRCQATRTHHRTRRPRHPGNVGGHPNSLEAGRGVPGRRHRVPALPGQPGLPIQTATDPCCCDG